MVSAIELLSYGTLVLYGLALLLCVAIGLFYLSELVEEYTVATGKVIRATLYIVTFLQLFLPFLDGLPMLLTLIGIAAHVTYFQLLARYPAFYFTSPAFIASCIFFIIHHILAFSSEALYSRDFMYSLTYFTFFVWTVPFMFLISLSANDEVLPQTMDYSLYPEARPLLNSNDDLVSSFLKGKRRSLFSFLSYLRDQLPTLRSKKLY